MLKRIYITVVRVAPASAPDEVAVSVAFARSKEAASKQRNGSKFLGDYVSAVTLWAEMDYVGDTPTADDILKEAVAYSVEDFRTYDKGRAYRTGSPVASYKREATADLLEWARNSQEAVTGDDGLSMARIRESGGGEFDGMPHAPEYDYVGADAVREARIAAHRRIIARFREQEEADTAEARRRAIEADAAMSELAELCRNLPPASKGEGAAARLDRLAAHILRCAVLGVSRDRLLHILRVPSPITVEWLAAHGFPPLYSQKTND